MGLAIVIFILFVMSLIGSLVHKDERRVVRDHQQLSDEELITVVLPTVTNNNDVGGA